MASGIDIGAIIVAAFMILAPMAAGAAHTAHANASATIQQGQ